MARIPKRGPCSSAGLEHFPEKHVRDVIGGWHRFSAENATRHNGGRRWLPGAISTHSGDRMLIMMSRFYFHLVRGETRVNDRTGIEVCSDVLKLPAVFDIVKERWPGIDEAAEWQGWTVEIADSEGRIVRTVSLL